MRCLKSRAFTLLLAAILCCAFACSPAGNEQPAPTYPSTAKVSKLTGNDDSVSITFPLLTLFGEYNAISVSDDSTMQVYTLSFNGNRYTHSFNSQIIFEGEYSLSGDVIIFVRDAKYASAGIPQTVTGAYNYVENTVNVISVLGDLTYTTKLRYLSGEYSCDSVQIITPKDEPEFTAPIKFALKFNNDTFEELIDSETVSTGKYLITDNEVSFTPETGYSYLTMTGIYDALTDTITFTGESDEQLVLTRQG